MPRSKKPRAARSVTAGSLADLRKQGALKFAFRREGFPREGFVIESGGVVKAYVNRCPHAGTTLDFGDAHFFTDDGALLACKTHGALFTPDTGFCVAGPCYAQSLEPLTTTVTPDGTIAVSIPPFSPAADA